MIAAAIFIIWTLACAVKEAQEDYDLIVDNKPVHHTFSEWIDRAIIVVAGGAFIIFTWVLFAGLPVLQWRLLCWIPIGWAAFTMGFRYSLNSMRKLDWRYVSRSNGYDTVFLDLTATWSKNLAELIIRDNVKLAGQVAYTFEALVLITPLIIFSLA